MKKLLIVLLVILVFFSFATAKEKIREVGISGTMPVVSFFNFTAPTYRLILKAGNEKSLYRLSSIDAGTYIRRGISIYGNESDTSEATFDDNSLSLGIAFGREIRKKIDDNLEFRYGADILLGYTRSLDLDEQDGPYLRNYYRKTFTTGVELVLGFNYVINEKFVIGIEINPMLSYTNYHYISERIYDVDETNYYENSYDQFMVDLDDRVLFSFSYRF